MGEKKIPVNWEFYIQWKYISKMNGDFSVLLFLQLLS